MIKYKLEVSESFKKSSIAERKKICNGCGPTGWKGRLVPDKIAGMNLKPACQQHDWDYHFGKTWEDKKIADKRFLNNLEIIENNTGMPFWIIFKFQKRRLIKIRQNIIIGYYKAVKYFGSSAFWDRKERQ